VLMTRGTFAQLTVYDFYRSGEPLAIGHRFLAPILPVSVLYQRAAGFFSSSVLEALASAFSTFFGAGGTWQLVCSSRLSPEDIRALRHATYEPARSAMAWNSVAEAFAARSSKNLLAFLVARRLIRIRIAVARPADDVRMYHEKIGILRDGAGRLVA